MPLIVAIVLFIVFGVNIGMGAALNAAFLTDVQELLLLGCIAVLFVIAILKKEADAQK